MAKLLEFHSKRHANLSTGRPDAIVENMVMEDTWMGLTPDLPRLRYKGPQLVFMWDACRDTDWLERRGLKKNKDFMVKSWHAMTCKKYLPFLNKTENNRNFGAYLPRTVNWYQSFGDRGVGEALRDRDPEYIGGRIFSMSAEAIRQLDAYYGNTASHSRTLVPVYRGRTQDSDKIMCWVYMTNISSIAKYDPHLKAYKMSDGIVPTGVPKTTFLGANRKFFEVNITKI